MTKRKKVFVAMSGGVDSSVAAALLKKRGFDVIGVYMKCWSLTDCAEEDARDARRVAGALNIPFYVFNFENEFKKKVVDYMISEYADGKTPNPDVMCNRKIKFGLFLKKSLALGADYIATGHYVRLQREFLISNLQFPKMSKILSSKKIKNLSAEDSLKIANCKLKIAKDGNKDQSYFLWTLTQDQLKHCIFPIGDYTKPQVRIIAKKYNLPTAGKPDSQGVCFVGEIDVSEFLKEKLGKKPGPIKTLDGRIIGNHDGAVFYTIGQRRGIGIQGSLPGEQGKIYYVAAKDLKTNTIFVAEDKDENLFANELLIKNVNWISGRLPELPLNCLARIRYRQPLQKAKLFEIKNQKSKIKNIRFLFEKSQRAVTPGQSAVFYSSVGTKRAKAGAESFIILGGGIIQHRD